MTRQIISLLVFEQIAAGIDEFFDDEFFHIDIEAEHADKREVRRNSWSSGGAS